MKRLRVQMRLVEADGSASVGALVCFYHTDALGDYGPNAHAPRAGSEDNYARPFRWAVTNAAGIIEILTIRSGGYSNDGPLEHTHVRIMCRDKRLFGGDTWFDDDPRLTRKWREDEAVD